MVEFSGAQSKARKQSIRNSVSKMRTLSLSEARPLQRDVSPPELFGKYSIGSRHLACRAFWKVGSIFLVQGVSDESCCVGDRALYLDSD
jgi:hypothetical protein